MAAKTSTRWLQRLGVTSCGRGRPEFVVVSLVLHSLARNLTFANLLCTLLHATSFSQQIKCHDLIASSIA